MFPAKIARIDLMPLRIRWNPDRIRDDIAPAYSADGEGHRLRFANFDQARKFRDSCYNLRRRRGIGIGLSFIIEEAQDDDGEIVAQVLIKRTPTIIPQPVKG